MKGRIEDGKQRFYQRYIRERFMSEQELFEFQHRYDDAKKIAIADRTLIGHGYEPRRVVQEPT